MPTLLQNFNFGSAIRESNPELGRQLSQMYTDLALAINQKPARYVTDGNLKPNVNPPASSPFNKNFDVGDFYVRIDTDSAWIMTSRVDAENVTWKLIT